MAEFEVKVVRIEEPVEDHPNADRLSLVKIGGYTCISAKLEDGSHRYKEGDLVVYIPEGAIVPEWWLKANGFWDNGKDRGMLSGSGANRVKAIKLRQVFSQGILQAVSEKDFAHPTIHRGDGGWRSVEEGDNVADFLGITKYEPSVPSNMAGEMGALYGVTLKYDFDSLQKQPKLFVEGEEVFVTEKLHGTNIQIGIVYDKYVEGDGVYVTSKGLGARGFNLKDVPENDGNIYVQALRKLKDNGTIAAIVATGILFAGSEPVRIFGELFGSNIQDLSYGKSEPTLAVFDVMCGDVFLTPAQLIKFCQYFDLPMVPVLYQGAFDTKVLEKLRDGKDTYSNSHVREGIVIQAVNERKIAKWVSPDYLLRKGETTEFS
jgi:RNA ligase (TIGR02306 family)